MSKDYVGDLMNLLQRDSNNGKFDYDNDDYIIIDDDYDDDYDYDEDDDIIVIDDDCDDDQYQDEFDDRIVVDNEYVPDEFEEDLFDNKYSRKNSDADDISIFDLCDDEPSEFSFDGLLNKNKKEMKNKKVDKEILDDKIAKNIAKDVNNAEVQLSKTDSHNDDDSWLTEDMFGNDIGKIIVEEEPKEKETYTDDDFSDWASKSKSKKTK